MSYHANFHVTDSQGYILKDLASKSNSSVSDVLRRMVESFAMLHGPVMSGATVIAIEALTTSGRVWIAKGF